MRHIFQRHSRTSPSKLQYFRARKTFPLRKSSMTCRLSLSRSPQCSSPRCSWTSVYKLRYFHAGRTSQLCIPSTTCRSLHFHPRQQNPQHCKWTTVSTRPYFQAPRTSRFRMPSMTCRSMKSRLPRRSSRPRSPATVSRLLGWTPSKRFAARTRSTRGRK